MRINVTGSALVITSSLKLDDIQAVKKYRPEALTLMGGEDGKEPIFALNVTAGYGSLNRYGASFSDRTNNPDGYAVITMLLDDTVTDPREIVADKFGAALIHLGELEESLPGILDDIHAQRNAIMNMVETA